MRDCSAHSLPPDMRRRALSLVTREEENFDGVVEQTMRQALQQLELVVPLPSCVGPHSEKTPASAKPGRSEMTL